MSTPLPIPVPLSLMSTSPDQQQNSSMSKYALRSPLMKHALRTSNRSKSEVVHNYAVSPPDSIRQRRRMTYEVPDLKIHSPLSNQGSLSNDEHELGEDEDFKYFDDVVNELSSAGSLSPEESPRPQIPSPSAVCKKEAAAVCKQTNKLKTSLANIKSPRCLRKFMFRREDAILSGKTDDDTSNSIALASTNNRSSENIVLSPRPFLNSTGSSRHNSTGSTETPPAGAAGTNVDELNMCATSLSSSASSVDSTSICTRIMTKMEELDRLERQLKRLKSGDMRLVIKDDTILLSMGNNSRTAQNSEMKHTDSANILDQSETQCAYLAYLDYLSLEEELAEALGEYEASMVKRRSNDNQKDAEQSEDLFPKVHAQAVERLRRNPRKVASVNRS